MSQPFDSAELARLNALTPEEMDAMASNLYHLGHATVQERLYFALALRGLALMMRRNAKRSHVGSAPPRWFVSLHGGMESFPYSIQSDHNSTTLSALYIALTEPP